MKFRTIIRYSITFVACTCAVLTGRASPTIVEGNATFQRYESKTGQLLDERVGTYSISSAPEWYQIKLFDPVADSPRKFLVSSDYTDVYESLILTSSQRRTEAAGLAKPALAYAAISHGVMPSALAHGGMGQMIALGLLLAGGKVDAKDGEPLPPRFVPEYIARQATNLSSVITTKVERRAGGGEVGVRFYAKPKVKSEVALI